jgi:ATP phosphoribosyltransferase regulatory subunit
MLLGDPGLFSGLVNAMGLSDTAAIRLIRAFRSERALAVELERASNPADEDRHAKLADLLGGLPDAEATGVLEELWRLSGIDPVGGRSAAEIVHRLAARAEAARAPRLSPAEADLIERFLNLRDTPQKVLDQAQGLAREAGGDLGEALCQWDLRLKGLKANGVPDGALTLSTGFVRPFGYYDGMLFEIRSAALHADQPVAAGGRYDGLPSRLGGQPGAVGCMVRPGRAVKGVAA